MYCQIVCVELSMQFKLLNEALKVYMKQGFIIWKYIVTPPQPSSDKIVIEEKLLKVFNNDLYFLKDSQKVTQKFENQ